MKTTTTIATKTMYYDIYECEFGDGFYPQLLLQNCTNNSSVMSAFSGYKSADIEFELTIYNNELIWVQNNEKNITGLDGNHGVDLLISLNSEMKVNAIKIINKYGDILYPKKQKKN
jgi:hypothetical protein